ncbi:MAG: UDP-N-acetylmuramoyl-tripeptide--D-alanyl-D-alanine ligase, partial [Alphaproteobacteria bacterium]|nr:UDP-N-acetylmuramoyl-tripeptide--D-alanyl-D-alanine ligase [Alphaproteobacteria bacterium]
ARDDLFIAIKGEQLDGHGFIKQAFEAGACAVLAAAHVDLSNADLSAREESRILRVPDTLIALQELGRAARARMKGKVVAVTGSVGKTSIKEGLRAALDSSGATHASQASYNNLWGVPLSLARMPAATEFGIFEIGMNHAGEITPLVEQVQPDIALITNIAPAHIAHFENLGGIAAAKAEIFTNFANNLSNMKIALLPADSEWFDYLQSEAKKAGAKRIVSFGESKQADSRAISVKLHADCSCMSANILGQAVALRIGLPGKHMVINSLSILAAVHLLNADIALAALALGKMEGLAGRGRRHDIHFADGTFTLIDESYNANPASMTFALKILGQSARYGTGRRIAVLGDMKELGKQSVDSHRALARHIQANDIDLVFTLGDSMHHLHENLPPNCAGLHTNKLDALIDGLLAEIQDRDIVMVKGSNSMHLSKLVESLLGLDESAGAAETRERG